MRPERETPLKDLRFAADLRRQFQELAAAAPPPRGSLMARLVAWMRRHKWTAGVAATSAAALCLVLIGVPGLSRLGGPQPVSAADIMQKMLRAWASCRTLQADSYDRLHLATPGGEYGYTVRHARVLMRSDGSWRITRTDKPQTGPVEKRDRYDAEDVAYDAAHAVSRDYVRGWDTDADAYLDRVVVTTGYPLGPPDCYPAFAYDFSAMARALQAGAEASLETTIYEGRPAWQITMSTRAIVGPRLAKLARTRWATTERGDEVGVVVIDRETCLPVSFRAMVGKEVQFEYRWTQVRVDEPLPDDAFSFAPPEGARVIHQDSGFRRLSLAEVGSAADGVAPLPSWLPAGYVARWAAAGDVPVTANGQTECGDVVAAQYVRGFDGLTVTTRRVADPRRAAEVDPIEDASMVWWSDLLTEKVLLTKGAFAGTIARYVLGPQIGTPHLWVVKDEVMLTVAGAATAEELVTIAESVPAGEPAASPSPSP